MRDLAAAVYAVPRDELTASQVEATRRACRRLQELDRAAVTYGVKPHPGLVVRLPITAEERKSGY